jgi:hypothetical protein
VALSARDWLLISVMGLGPLGAAFFLWDKALKRGDARQIGILSYITPLARRAAGAGDRPAADWKAPAPSPTARWRPGC